VEDALNAGVKVVATAHAGSLAELRKRPFFRYLWRLQVIERYVLLGTRERPGTITAVMDGTGKRLGGVRCCG